MRKKEADRQIRQHRHVQLGRIAHHLRSRRDCSGRASMKHQGSVGGRIDVRCGSPASNVRAAYKQWMVTKGVRDLDPDFRPASAGMHDEAQALVPEALETPWHEWLWGCRPRSDPPFAVGKHRLRGTDRRLFGRIL